MTVGAETTKSRTEDLGAGWSAIFHADGSVDLFDKRANSEVIHLPRGSVQTLRSILKQSRA